MQVELVLNALRSENSRLQCFVAQLTARNEMLSLQLKQQERHSEKRRREVTSLHQACAEHKRVRVECAQRQRKRRRSSETKAPMPTLTPTSPLPPPPPNDDVSGDAAPAEVVSFRTHSCKQAFDICFSGHQRRRHQRTLEGQFDAQLNAALEESERDFQIGREKFFRLVDEERAHREAARQRRVQNMHLDRSIDQHLLMLRRRRNGSADAG